MDALKIRIQTRREESSSIIELIHNGHTHRVEIPSCDPTHPDNQKLIAVIPDYKGLLRAMTHEAMHSREATIDNIVNAPDQKEVRVLLRVMGDIAKSQQLAQFKSRKQQLPRKEE